TQEPCKATGAPGRSDRMRLISQGVPTMQIQSVLSGQTDPASKRQTELFDALTSRSLGNGGRPEASANLSTADATRSILGAYDVTRITPRQFTEMIQQLHDAGTISQQEFEQLATIRLDMDSAGIDPDQSVDLVQFYRDKIEGRSQNGFAQAAPDALTRRLDWIEKFALIQEEPDSLGIDAFA
ncbi:MAG: hypothetical protein U1E05_17350, partial [Patescibacteria group bacterium]|nr:hypothetical protein [Patescibacteria group bacterium]